MSFLWGNRNVSAQVEIFLPSEISSVCCESESNLSLTFDPILFPTVRNAVVMNDALRRQNLLTCKACYLPRLYDLKDNHHGTVRKEENAKISPNGIAPLHRSERVRIELDVP